LFFGSALGTQIAGGSSRERKKIALTRSKQDRFIHSKRWLLVILLLFLPVSFEKKKSNKIPAVLDAEKGVNFCCE
jgi:hypothetical protein